MMHVIVENQIALGDEIPVRRTAQRLIVQGLNRHEVVHGIGMVLAEHMSDMLKQQKLRGDPNQPYYDALEVLTGDAWREAGV
jgi:hypothetical protein